MVTLVQCKTLANQHMQRSVKRNGDWDTTCVELKFADSSTIAIDCTAVEREVARNMYERSELDYMIFNDPLGYAELILNSDVEQYLRDVTEYKPLD